MFLFQHNSVNHVKAIDPPMLNANTYRFVGTSHPVVTSVRIVRVMNSSQ